MPNRQEVLDALRILSEEVLESLRILFHLFYMLVTMTRAVQPEEGVTEASTDQRQSSSCPDSRHTGGMGRQISDMGKEACRTRK